MELHLVRIYTTVNIEKIKAHLIIYGTLSATCANCNEMELTLDMNKCPKCGTEFSYVAFRNPREHMPKILKLTQERPQLKIIDYDDFKKLTGKKKAEEFFND